MKKIVAAALTAALMMLCMTALGEETVLTPVGEEAMAWNIGDNGFEMVLGTYVPHIIDEHIVEALRPLLARDESLTDLPYRDIEHWAIHPGGRSIGAPDQFGQSLDRHGMNRIGDVKIDLHPRQFRQGPAM